jgi:hypothetical protein
MVLPELIPSARRSIEQAHQAGRELTFHVSKVKERRWNWILTMRYIATDPATGEAMLRKVFLQTSKDRESLEVLREYLEDKYGTP